MVETVMTPSPVALELSPLRGLLIIDLADDATYRTLEPQLIDGAEGVGLTLLAYRHDGRVELYAEGHLELDLSGYDGLKLDIALHAPNGRRFELHLHEPLKDRRDHFPLLAPVGGSFNAPAFFPFLWLPTLSFVPVRRTEVTLRVDGQPRTVSRLPLPIGGRRCLMARYDLDAMVCQLNPSWVTDPSQTPAGAPGSSHHDQRVIVEVDGQPALAGLRISRGAHSCAVRLDPPLADDLPLGCHPGSHRLPGGRVELAMVPDLTGATPCHRR